MESKDCVICNTERSIDNSCKKYRDCKPCNFERSTNCYYENKDKISNQRKIYYEKNWDRQLQKQNDRYIDFKGLHRSYIELQNKLKTLKEKPHTQQIEIEEVYNKT